MYIVPKGSHLKDAVDFAYQWPLGKSSNTLLHGLDRTMVLSSTSQNHSGRTGMSHSEDSEQNHAMEKHNEEKDEEYEDDEDDGEEDDSMRDLESEEEEGDVEDVVRV